MKARKIERILMKLYSNVDYTYDMVLQYNKVRGRSSRITLVVTDNIFMK